VKSYLAFSETGYEPFKYFADILVVANPEIDEELVEKLQYPGPFSLDRN
jgi:hypothetical protein